MNTCTRSRNAWALAACLGFALLTVSRQTPAQGSPDIVWKTNAHSDQVTGVAFVAGSSMLASSSLSDGFNGFVHVWSVADTALLKTFTLSHEDVLCLTASPDGNYLAAGGGGSEDDGVFRIWRVSDWFLLLIGGAVQNDWVRTVAISADSVYCTRGTDSGSWLPLGRVDAGLAFGSTDEPPHDGPINAVSFAPNASTLVSAGEDGIVKLWDYTNGLCDDTLLQTFSEHSGPVIAVAYLPNGEELISAGANGQVIIRRLSDGVRTRTIQAAASVGSMAVSPDGKTFFTAGDTLKFWRISDGALLRSFDEEVQSIGAVTVASTGKHFAYGRADGTVVLASMPLWIESTRRTAKQLILKWQGGSGRYQLQSCTNLTTGAWQNAGTPTVNTSATNTVTSPVFYRVQSLPNL